MKTRKNLNLAVTAALLAGGLMLIPNTAHADHDGRRNGRGYRDRDDSRFRVDFHFGDREPAYCPPTHHRQWVPGHYEVCYEQVLVQPGHYDRVWHPPQYVIRYDYCGRPHRVCVSPGHYDEVWHEAEYETRAVRKWVPGRWVVVETAGHYHHGRGNGIVVSGSVEF